MTYTCSACGTTRTNEHKLTEHKNTQCKSVYAKPSTGFSLPREALHTLEVAWLELELEKHNA